MDYTQRSITVTYCLNLDTKSYDVVDLVKSLALSFHLLINTEDMLYSSINLSTDICFGNVLLNFSYDLIDKVSSFGKHFIQLITDISINIRIEILHAEVIHFNLDLGNTEPVSKRSIDIHGLACLLNLLLCSLILKSSEVMQTVGQLNDDNSDVLCHGKEHLTKVLSLNLYLILRQRQLGQLCNAINKKRNLRRKLLLDILTRLLGIFDNIMKETCNNGLFIHLKAG